MRHGRGQHLRRALLLILLTGMSHPAWGQTGGTQSTASASVTGTTDWDAWKHDCSDLVHDPGKKSLLACGTDTFRARPFHFVAQTVVPGSAVGPGGEYSKDLNKGVWQNQLQLTGVFTIREFGYADARFTARRPRLGSWNKAEENFAIEIYGQDRQLPQMTYYGLGPNTTLSGAAEFSQRDARAGVIVSNPLTSWLGLTGTFEGLFPSVGGVTSASAVSINQAYTEQTAPGLASQPNFLHYEVLLRPHVLVKDRFLVDYRLRYGYFQDTDTGHYSFRRLDTDFRHSFFPERENGHRRADSVLTEEVRIAASDASAGNAIPFYLQETIGGSGINNEPTLRAFKDYRFRAPNLILAQTEYDRRIIGPVGILLFYDAGKVTLAKSDLNFSGLRQGAGGGLSFFLGGQIVFRAYVGAGSGEGVHPFFGIANFLP
jgi:hypothetical protein